MKKNLFLLLTAMMACTILFIWGCQKSAVNNADSLTEVKPDVKSIGQANTVSSAYEISNEPTGTLYLTKEQYDASMNGEQLQLSQVEPHIYEAAIPNTGGGIDDPCGGYHPTYLEYYHANIAAWQAIANATCKTICFAYSNPCICVLGIVKPNSKNCFFRDSGPYEQAKEKITVPVFEMPSQDLHPYSYK